MLSMTKFSIDQKLSFECKNLGVVLKNCAYERTACTGKVNAWRLTPKRIKATILIIHGTGVESLFPYLGLYYSLLKNDYEICCFDLDGHGHLSSTYFHESHITSCLHNAINAFSLNDSKTPVYLLGHSLGGVLALQYLAKEEHSIKKTIIVSSPSYVRLSSRMFFHELISLFYSSIRKQIPYYGWHNIFPPICSIKRKDFPIRMVGANNLFQSLGRIIKYINGAHINNLVSKINCPLLFIYSTCDYLSPLKQGEKLHHLSKSSSFYLVKGESHLSAIFSLDLHKQVVNWLNDH